MTSTPAPENADMEPYICDIHSTPFTWGEDGGCPDCLSEWHPINMEDEDAQTSNGK